MLSCPLFDPVSLPEQDFDYAVTEIALNDDLALFRRTAHTAFAFEQASQLFQGRRRRRRNL